MSAGELSCELTSLMVGQFKALHRGQSASLWGDPLP